MWKLNILIFTLCCLSGVSVGQIIQNGQCDPNIQLVEDFDFEKFSGTWYEIQRSKNPEQNDDCAQFDITRSGNNINVYHRGVNNNWLEESRGSASLTNGTARLTLDIPMFEGHQHTSSKNGQLEIEGEVKDFWVLLTNYENFAVTYSCKNISPTQKSINLWVLGRTRQFNELIPALISNQLNQSLGVTLNDLSSINHSDAACYVLPVIAPGQPVIIPGQCDPNIPVVRNFNVTAFTGIWNQIASYYSDNAGGACNRANYTLGNGVVNVINSEVNNQTLRTISGTASVNSTDGSAKLRVILNVNNQNVESDLWVLATDYTNYAVSYTCQNFNATHQRLFSWIASRQRQLSPASQVEVDRVIDSLVVLNSAYYTTTNQSDAACFYYPEVTGQPVVFPGQCDRSIPVIQNFNAAAYLGLWHTIEQYPAANQDGTCSNAYYTLNPAGYVDVYNTDVVGQQLNVATATADLSPDGSSKLNVTFPIAGTNAFVSTDYWVLATDFTTYALVYSCTNIGTDSRRVASWKLSRTKNLTAVANAAMNQVISTINVLDQRYYQQMNQTTAGCFYYPTPQPGVPVVFPGACDSSLAMQNFNLTQFQGTWYETEAYPKEEQTGQCISHVFTAGANNRQLNLTSSSVTNQFLGVTNGVISASDNSGRLTITIPGPTGTPIQIPFWILNTDYNNYALAYACVPRAINTNPDFRAVWSWKLSRTKQLSAASNTTISNAIANIDVLNNTYYEKIGQSDSACFYLPEIPPGQPIILPGQCDPNIRGVANFNVSRFLGTWNQISSYFSDNAGGTCNRAQYSLGDGVVNVVNSQVNNQTLRTITGTATVNSTDGSAKLRVILNVNNQLIESDLWVLGSDYDNYAISYSCQNLGNNQQRVFSWILSRQRQLSPASQVEVNKVIDSVLVLNSAYYTPTNQTAAGCFYYPEVTGQPVTFRGQCSDWNIPVIQNFNAAAYLGLWHTIEQYPAAFQDGTCSNAFYTLNPAGYVDVYNTDVVGQQLNVATAIAELSPDGSSKLNVTFPVAGTDLFVSTGYWVLATDFTTYALVYSCTDIDNDNMRVSSWKLSRTKNLSAIANTVINQVISTINVLDQRYYQQMNQTTAGCFYYPTPQPGVPVVFPGACDSSLAMQNFNLTQFQGTWYETEAYPKEEQTGQCISHVFTAGANNRQLNLTSSSVTNQFLGVTNGVISASDNSGRLTITIPGPIGAPIQIPFWILNTDYNNYALAYACVPRAINTNPDFRAVWSWKLSRTKQLSAASNTTISNAIANIDVLNNTYYEKIDQSDSACFYLPEIPPGQPIILPGQCDPNIRGVANFNVSRFLGTWNQISSYFSDNAGGTCNRAQYSLGDGVVNVVNSQVNNQTLRTITGTATVNSTDGSAKLRVILNVNNQLIESDLWVLGSDYDNYAISYSCQNLGNNQQRVFSWILSRQRQLSPASQVEVNKVIDSVLVLNSAYYTPTNQTAAGCFYYPEVTGQPVTFRGQCSDWNIPVIQNFNAAAYLGLWHTIEQYPAAFQDGTCSNAFYTLNPAGYVDVYNTDVVGQQLNVATAIAELSPDGSSKLNVTFPVAGTDLFVSTGYWVLATDFTTYALVYSCTDIDNDNMRVSSWKLSRTKSLSAAANTVINQVISTINVLDQRYYQQMNQTTAGCFYYPTPQPGVPVVFPGACDSSLALPNFNLTQFQGTWYETEAYPKEEQTGQCISHVYTAGANNRQLNLTSSSVNNQFLGVTNGVLSASDNSSRLTITIPGPTGAPIQIPFWVLNTDYNNYALAYACVPKAINTNPDFRAVWSWKLSRTKQLSAASNTTISNAIANIDVLNNTYYEKIDQSDSACFYLPEIPPGQPIILPGQCDPNIRGVPNFNVSRFLGTWNQISSYFSDNAGGTCNRAQYSLGDGVVNVVNSQVNNQTLRTITGTATVNSTDGSAKLRVILNVNNQLIESDLWVLGSDYDNYAISYSCQNLGNNQQRVFSWILSRQRQLSPASQVEVNKVIDSVLVLNSAYYTPTNQTAAGCFYYPEVTGRPVTFRGQCSDWNIPVIQNFNAAAYLGLWHTIEQYPAANQDGTCSNAFYTLNPAGYVDVYNTDVVGQQLNIATAIAELSPDGSSKLNVTFPVAGTDLFVSTGYWVLATDFTTYALVYSCTDIDNDNMRVSSWKLSRTKSLSAIANTVINQVISTINVLDQRYYQQMNQTTAGCFYYPTPQPGIPVVFPGACDSSLALPNFNLTQFKGTWYEIEAYPKEEQTGQCISHVYTAGANNQQLNLTSSSVNNQFLNVTNGVISAFDNTGRLTITILGPTGTPIQIPFWIVSTDYNNYALAYACVPKAINTNPDFRAVWSWKLSRTKQLSAASNTTINNAITNIDVLNNTYYQNINQSAQTCFHLPKINPRDPVILPGQCDTSIRGVANFNLSRYSGRWRLVESYGSNHQIGNCNVARYTYRNATTVDVENSEVAGQALRRISGTAYVVGTEGRLRFEFSARRIDEYIILATDYTSYALAYKCENIDTETRRIWSWKLSRNDTLSVAANNSINQIVNSIDVLHNPYYYKVGRSEADCFYFPEVNPNVEVRFRGQCNQNIPAVPNFDVARYLNLWHDIASYPMQFQFGTCPNAFYSLGSANVTVSNTQVINKTLDVQLGTASVASTDGSGKLRVRFNVNGRYVTSDYWVLATDYTNYAFVYSCDNIDDEFIRVYSWKLSRTKALSAAANTAINNVLNNYNILDNRYFVNQNQTAEGCFHYPEPQPKSPVIFPGQCDNAIPAIQNFNQTRFLGVWHETSSYYYLESGGQCVNHRFALGTTSPLTLETNNVNNDTLLSSNSPVNLGSNDGSGRLTINILVNGQTRTIPFWILATDYTDYALAYGCVNINSDYRQVYSWKLSRSRIPSTAGTTAINNAMTNIDVLDNRYFENVQQTNEACFYLPDIPNNVPVEFFGQCEQNIPVVRNFNASAYTGRWRLIESYYSARQQGTCNEANYSQGPGSTIVVTNSVVVNQQLNSITGSATAAADGSGKLSVTFPSSSTPTELWVLATDYTSYTLAYSCENIVGTDRRRVWSWKMSRTNTLTPAANTAINSVVNSINVLNQRYYSTVNRTDAGCFYYPEPNANNPVVFPGQCDLSIPALPNFNASRYLGSWYDVESYPAPFQNGTCPTAEYSANPDGSVHLINSQVVNQLLQSWNGTAVVVSNDGSAKLNVTINVNGIDVTTNLWVLSTDYTSYSLAYSCMNRDTESRVVSSWKLSRSQTLSAAANTTINAVINSIPVLDERYYVKRNNTPEGCFNYPDNFGGDVILDGQCPNSASVPAVTNFNINAFAGTWYEIARFPSSLQNAECISSEYVSSGANRLTISQSAVSNDRIRTVSTQATVDANGRGIINLNASGVEFNNIYVLGTDYSEYALLYSCRNLNSTKKQIYSWKISKSRQLSASANAVIDQLVSSNIDLHPRYYRTTGQDTNSCFYYPVFDTLPSSIVMPVPCLDSIRGVPNFNLNSYSGRWFETARYPTTDYKGQCNRAEYSNNNFSFNEVVNQTLVTENGIATQAADSSGQFNVEVNVNGVIRRFNYYVIATDYSSYSLVYSCANLNNGSSIVSAWKRSRAPTLTPAASAAIDNVINNTRGISEEYFLPTSQSEADCFYIPPLNVTAAPRFRGQCEAIREVQGFNVSRYLGWWHEIERYPINETPGECRSSQYTQDGSTYRVVDSLVANNNGVRTEGTVVISNTGRIRRTIPGRPTEDIWVLATDYETYALLYSCVNFNTEYKTVWSAIHSKTRDPISAQAKAAIAPIIANNSVLVENFYLPVNQSDAACFHYPAITSGDIIIPGQCDSAIPVVQNFNASRFGGDWYHTERYDDVGTSTCVGSRFTVGNQIEVINFEVNNNELQTANGTAKLSTDNSARIELSLSVAGSSATRITNVLVLSTDYTNYALVYNCDNVNAFQRRVRAWKLSRERTQSAAGTTAINALIQQRQELHQPYFKTITQNEDCPKPSSALIINSSIIMLLVCALLHRLL